MVQWPTQVTTALQGVLGAGSPSSDFAPGRLLSSLLLRKLAAPAQAGGMAVTTCALESVTWEGTTVPVDGSMKSGL